MTKEFKWGTIVPLIGGMTVAGKAVTGEDPDFLLTYTPFCENERNVTAYFPDVPYHKLDEENMGGFDVAANQDVDFIQALCPCAGLSLLSSGSEEQRAGMNKWMLQSANFITGEVRPKVFFGENAPGLYTKLGEKVRGQLREIAAKNGYSFSVFCTNTMYHGIPQVRKRSFYFFWRDSGVPVFKTYRRTPKSWKDYMAEVSPDALHQQPADIKAAQDHLLTNPYVMFLQEKYNGQGITDMRRYLNEKHSPDSSGFTLHTYLLRTEQMEEARDWLKANGFDKHHRESVRILAKISNGKGFWDGSFPVYRPEGYFNTLIARTLYAIHPVEDRTLTTRECMHLMGLPEDFELVTGAQNHICQNVPVTTASDMTREVIAYLRGEREISGAKFMMQSNLTERIDHQESSLLTF